MQNRIKPFLTELFWLTICFWLTVLLAAFLFGWDFLNEDLDIHLHDTYFVFSTWSILTPFFLFVTFVLYVVKEKRKSFSRTFPNWLIIISGLTLVFSVTLLIKKFSQFANMLTGGWTAYPPLSALKDPEPQLTENTLAKFIANFLTIVQFFILLLLLYVSYCWGTQKRSKQKE